MVNMLASIINQEYTADINIYPDFRKFDFRKILSHLTEDELLQLVRQGELATWAQVERIRLSSAISRTLDEILEQYGEEEMRHAAHKRIKKKAQGKPSPRKKAAG
jgi:NTE family protein